MLVWHDIDSVLPETMYTFVAGASRVNAWKLNVEAEGRNAMDSFVAGV